MPYFFSDRGFSFPPPPKICNVPIFPVWLLIFFNQLFLIIGLLFALVWFSLCLFCVRSIGILDYVGLYFSLIQKVVGYYFFKYLFLAPPFQDNYIFVELFNIVSLVTESLIFYSLLQFRQFDCCLFKFTNVAFCIIYFSEQIAGKFVISDSFFLFLEIPFIIFSCLLHLFIYYSFF